jgi:hypothetical protein
MEEGISLVGVEKMVIVLGTMEEIWTFRIHV